jgi:hypothetical protein
VKGLCAVIIAPGVESLNLLRPGAAGSQNQHGHGKYLAYWLEPVISFGRIAPVVTTPDDAAGQGNPGGGPSKQQEALKA